MSDSDKIKALQLGQAETLQKAMEGSIFTHPLTGQTHAWKKFAYTKSLIRKFN
jgi:hypothetical protein